LPFEEEGEEEEEEELCSKLFFGAEEGVLDGRGASWNEQLEMTIDELLSSREIAEF